MVKERLYRIPGESFGPRAQEENQPAALFTRLREGCGSQGSQNAIGARLPEAGEQNSKDRNDHKQTDRDQRRSQQPQLGLAAEVVQIKGFGAELFGFLPPIVVSKESVLRE